MTKTYTVRHRGQTSIVSDVSLAVAQREAAAAPGAIIVRSDGEVVDSIGAVIPDDEAEWRAAQDAE